MKKIILLVSVCLAVLYQASPLSAQTINYKDVFIGGYYVDFYVDAPQKEVYYGNTFPNQPNTTFNYIPGSKKIALVSYFLKTDTLSLYRFTVIVDDIPLKINQSFEGMPVTKRMFYEKFNNVDLGIYNIANKSLTVLLYKIGKPDKIYKSIYYAKPIRAAKIEYFTKNYMDDNGDRGWTADPKNRAEITLSKKNSALNIIKNKADFDFLYDITIKEKESKQIIFKSTAWNYENSYYDEAKDDFLPFVSVDKKIFKKSGDYEIIIEPQLIWDIPQKLKDKYVTKHILNISVEEESFTKKELISSGILFSIIIGGITGGLAVYIKNKQARKKIAEQAEQKEIAKLQLDSVRSQLNPHFLFNALAGIQTLMNKNEIDNANRYLTKFARLTRNVLDHKELISLTSEKTLLDDYLQMEQLRFGFQYQITASPDLDVENIEIPAMLLQPFVENAVKHGIAAKGSDGKIEIDFTRKETDVILSVKDNGDGFDTAKDYAGLGLALTKNRISLLNSIYKETPFLLDMKADANGTLIRITINQWL